MPRGRCRACRGAGVAPQRSDRGGALPRARDRARCSNVWRAAGSIARADERQRRDLFRIVRKSRRGIRRACRIAAREAGMVVGSRCAADRSAADRGASLNGVHAGRMKRARPAVVCAVWNRVSPREKPMKPLVSGSVSARSRRLRCCCRLPPCRPPRKCLGGSYLQSCRDVQVRGDRLIRTAGTSMAAGTRLRSTISAGARAVLQFRRAPRLRHSWRRLQYGQQQRTQSPEHEGRDHGSRYDRERSGYGSSRSHGPARLAINGAAGNAPA